MKRCEVAATKVDVLDLMEIPIWKGLLIVAWFYLVIAGFTEIIWAIGLKEAQGFTVLVPSLVSLVFIVISFYLFSFAMKTIPIGTAYAVFTGIGAAGTAVVGIVVLNEAAGVGKLFFLLLLLVGIIGLKLVDGQGEGE